MNVHVSGWVFRGWRSQNKSCAAISVTKHWLMRPDITHTHTHTHTLRLEHPDWGSNYTTSANSTFLLPPVGQTRVGSCRQFLLAAWIWVSRCTVKIFTALFYCEPDRDRKKPQNTPHSYADLITRTSVWQVSRNWLIGWYANAVLYTVALI